MSGGRFLPAAEDAAGSGLAVGPRGSKPVGGPGALQSRKIKDNPVWSWSSEVRQEHQVCLVPLHDFGVYSFVAMTQIWHKILWPFHVGYYR